jgi:hypothetical protein
MSTLGISAMLPGKIFAEHMSVPSSIFQRRDQTLEGEGATPLQIQTLDELLDSVDCMELAERYGSFKKAGGYPGGLFGACLFCRAGASDERPLYVGSNDFRCGNCEVEGTAVEFFARMEGITVEEAVPRLAMLVKSRSLQRRRNEQEILWGIMAEASRYYHHLLCHTTEGEPGRKWLKEQGVTVEMREELHLGYFPLCHDGTQPELIERLVNLGYDSDIVVSAKLPVGRRGILQPIGDVHGHWWGFIKCGLWSENETLYYYLSDIHRLAPRSVGKAVDRPVYVWARG